MLYFHTTIGKEGVFIRRFQAVLKKLLFPGWGWVLLFTLLGGGALVLTFLVLGERHPFAYLAYPLSAYALTVLVAAVVPAIHRLWQALHRVPIAHRYLTDRHFQVRSSLILSFLINLCYAVFKLACAVWYASFWDGGLALYNILLCGVRAYLIRQVPKGDGERKPRRELHCYRATGFFLVVLDLALSVIATQIVRDGYGYNYPGTLIYVVALHAFYSLILSAVNAVKFRKLHSPVLSAAKAVNLTTAVVSIFSLETAMLSQFGSDQAEFRLLMTACTAVSVCAIVLGLAAYMVVSANRKLRRITR